MWILAASVALADCEEGSLEDLHLQLEAAEAAFADRDRDGVLKHSQAAREMLPCVEEPFTAPDAARYHRVEGLRYYLAADEDQARAYFAAARFAQPDYKLPSSLVPSGHPAQQLYAGADSFTTATEIVPAAAGSITFDGRASLDRPATRPTILQVLDEGGGVQLTALLEPGDPVPEYALAPVVEPTPEEPPAEEIVAEPGPEELGDDIVQTEPAQPRTGARRAVLASSGVGLVASGALFGLSGWAYQQYYACDEGDTDCQQQYLDLNHAFIIAGGTTAAVSVAGGLVGVAFTGEF